MLQPKEISLTTQDGAEKTYLIHKFPAIAGREIISMYPISNIVSLAKEGEYARSEEAMFKLLAFVSVKTENEHTIPLNTRALIDNHVPDWQVLMQLEWAMLEYNISFLQHGLKLEFLTQFSQKAASSIAPILTDLLQPLFGAVKQALKNSKPNTP